MSPEEHERLVAEAVLAERRRCSEHIAGCVPVGFSSPEEQQRYQALVDSLAIDILSWPDQRRCAPDALGGLLARLEEKLDLAYLQIRSEEHDVWRAETDKLLAETDRLLKEHGA